MAPLSLKIILDEGAITRTLMFDTTTTVRQAHHIIKDKILTLDHDKEYGFFLTSADNDCSGVWLEDHRTLEYYMLREGDSLYYLEKVRNLRVRMLDGSVKTMQVDESKNIGDLMVLICEKIGITNHDEYGLCREDQVEEEMKPMTGTLTLRKKTQIREKDAKLEQLRKKLKTDDNVEWLDQHKTLRELHVDPKETLLFKRRLFYSDRNVDSRDPVQLNLLYVQTRDAILDGRQLVTEDKAVEFAGIQCQIQYEDFIEDKHKSGFIENLKEFLPAQYSTSWGIEKRIFKEHKKHHGLSPLEAKNLYTKTARELPTYGVTFFLVKEKQKGKKKLVPRLLGINSESILRLDEETKEILQVWPLTQVKSYRAGSESFTLDFGDYSEKEYAVKTNDAMRIRDILQGYIDIIKKRLAAPYNVSYTQGEAMCEDNVEISRGTIMQNIVANKIVEQSFVGPSRIISVEQGQNASEGTKIITVHEMVTTTRTTSSQQAVKGEILSETPQTFGKRLNRMNSFSVKTVVLLSDPCKENIDDVHRIASNMESELPTLVKGVRETAKNLDPAKSKKLLDELDELCDYINNFSNLVNDPDCDSPEKVSSAKDYAMKIADISAQMYLALDPKTKGRAQLIKSSRNSFIADEKTEAHLRRLSFRTAAEVAHEAIDRAYTELDTQHTGPAPDAAVVESLEKALLNKIGKLNAAVALLLNAHSDPDNVDYSTAVTCMTTIKEYIPEIIQDVKALNSGENDAARLALTDEIKKLLDRTAALCRLTGTDDNQKMQDAGKAYGEVARKLIFTFNRGEKRRDAIDKENEIIDLAKDVGEKASNLLMDVNELNGLASEDPRTQEVDTAGAKCSDAARELVICAELTAPSIHEPHCQSALTAACENLSSSAQHLTNTYKPIIDDPGRHYYGKKLHNRALELMKALERLQDAYSNIDYNGRINENEPENQNNQRLKFIASLSGAKKALQDAEQQLENNNTNDGPKSEADVQRIRRSLAQKMAQLNAAIASLSKAVSENPDYKTTEAAMSTLSQLTPEILRDAKMLEAHMNDGTQQEMLQNLRAMLEATKNICASAENNNNQDLNEATMDFAKSSGKLYYIFNPRTDSRLENEIIDLAKDVGEKASYLLMDVNELNGTIAGDPRSDELDAAGVKCSDAASGLVSCAELVAPTIREARCQNALTSACENLASSAQQLAQSYKPIVDEPGRQDYRNKLHDRLKDLTKALERLQDAYSNLYENNENKHDANNDNERDKLKFIASISGAKKALQDAEKQLQDGNRDTFAKDNINTEADAQRLRKSLADKIARLNAAIASLSTAVSENPDYKTTEAAISALTQLTPEIMRDARMLESHLGDGTQQEMLQNLKDMLEATKNICASAENNDSQELNEATMEFAKSSGKLYYVFNPRRDTRKEDEVLDLAKDVGEKASFLLMDVNDLNGTIAGDTRSDELDAAGVKCSDAASALVASAELIAPTIRDSRCQKALTAASQNLASSAHQLARHYKPIVDEPGRHDYRNKLNDKFMDLLKSLEKLEEAYRNLYDDNDAINGNEADMTKTQKQKLTASLSGAKKALQDAEKQLQDVNRDNFVKDNTNTEADVQRLRNSLSQKIAQLNAAIASLSRAVSGHPDYQTTESAISTLSQITPEIIRDARILESYMSDGTQQEMLENLKAMVEATKNICASAENNNNKDLNEATMEFAKSSGKLYYVFNPRANSRKQNEITKLAKDVGDKTTVLLQEANQLSKVVPNDEQAKRIDDAGVKCADAAKELIASAEITAPTIHEARCQDTLTTACEKVASTVQDLAITYKPVVDHPSRQQFGKRLVVKSMDLIQALDKLKDAYSHDKFEDDSQIPDEKHEQKLQFKDNLSSAKRALLEAEQQLQSNANFGDETRNKIKNDADTENLRQSLSQKLAQLNAAIASLLRATTDDIDYDSANAAINTITQLTPVLVKDAKCLESHLDDKDQDKISENIRGMLEASKELIACAEDDKFKQLNEAAFDFANSSGKLYYVINPRANPRRENQILDLSRGACEDASRLLIKVYDLAKNVGGEDGAKLDDAGTKIVDSAQTFLTAAQMTGPTMYDPECQSAMISFTDKFSDLVKDLETLWTPLVEDKPDFQDKLQRDKDILQASLERLKAACLDNSMNEVNAEREQLLSTVSEAKDKIKHAQLLCSRERLRELPAPDVQSSFAMTADQGCIEKKSIWPTKMRLFDKLSHMNESTALLVQALSDDDNKDYKATEDIVKNISQLTPDIVQDALCMHEYVDDSTLQSVIEEAKSLCEASHDICCNVEAKDIEGLNKAASKYANSSGKLFYIFSSNHDVVKENQVLNMARSACERASLMLSRVSRLAQAAHPAQAQQLDTAGVKLADAAQVLLTNAQITAPSIQDARCQSALNSSIDRVSRIANDLGSIWKPLIQEPHLQLCEQLDKDLLQLQTELEKLKDTCQCIKSRTPRQSWAIDESVEMIDPKILESLNKSSTQKTPEADTQLVEDIIIEDTPLRELASKILNSVTHDIEQGNLTPEESKTKMALKNKLEAAIKALDQTNARCRRDPNDLKKREELENVILNLQHACLQSRRNGQESNIVDLMDYVKDVTEAADEIMTATISINPDHGKKALIDIRDECEKIKYNAEELSNPQEIRTDDSVIDNMMLIEKFAADCDNGVRAIEEAIKNIHDDHSKKILSEKHRQLTNTCDLLRFATKSSISSAAAANYEENLQNLLETEEKIREFLDVQNKSGQEEQPDKELQEARKEAVKDAQTVLFKTIVAGKDSNLPQVLTQYALKLEASTPKDSNSRRRLSEHLNSLSNLLKKLSHTRCRQIATWQEGDNDDIIDFTKEIQQELNSFDLGVEKTKPGIQTVNEIDLDNLFQNKKIFVSGDEKEIQAKFDQQTQKLNTLIGAVVECSQKPENLARNVHCVAASAAEVASIAKSMKNKDIIQESKIEECIKELKGTTYHLLKTSESAQNPAGRRKLLDACRALSEAVNKLARSVSPLDKAQRDCSELQRNLQLQQSFVSTDQPGYAFGFADCVDALVTQQDVIQKLQSEDLMSRNDCITTLRYVSTASCTSASLAAHSAYLVSISEDDNEVAKKGLVDKNRLANLTESIEEVVSKIMYTNDIGLVKNLNTTLSTNVQQYLETVEDCCNKVNIEDSDKIKELSKEVNPAISELQQAIHSTPYKSKDVLVSSARVLERVQRINFTINRLPLPKQDDSPSKRQDVKEIVDNARNLLSNTSHLVKQVSSSEEEVMTWVMYGRDNVIKAYEALLNCVRDKGVKSKLVQSKSTKEELDAPPKSNLQIQIELTNKWLQNPGCKPDVKAAAIKAAQHVIDMGDKMCEDLKDAEKEEMLHVVHETKQLLKDCSQTYNSEKASLLLERLRDLKKMLERGVVTRVVEDFLEDQPLEEMEAIHKEKDAKKREFLLDKKIAELLAQLGRVKRTAAFVSDTSTAPVRQELLTVSDQVELLAPSLVKAVQETVRKPEDEEAIDNYKKLILEYADSLSRVRDLCDRAVDPMDFAQAAGETMARIKESSQNDPQKSLHTSRIITKLGNRVVEAGMSSPNVQKDPELQKTLADIKNSISAAANARADLIAEIIRKTGEIESALGGETIFQKEAEPDQPIFAAAHGLHAAVRDWSARDNEVVAVAKRVAVLMAQLSHHMYNDRKRELIATSKAIVAKSLEVTQLARKLALQCTDIRIRNNLLQLCERIITISGQLKMLTTVKGSSLGHQGSEEDKEAMNMLVGNAQNLMISIREVVNGAESASVKIMSQRGRRIKWVRRNYY